MSKSTYHKSNNKRSLNSKIEHKGKIGFQKVKGPLSRKTETKSIIKDQNNGTLVFHDKHYQNEMF